MPPVTVRDAGSSAVGGLQGTAAAFPSGTLFSSRRQEATLEQHVGWVFHSGHHPGPLPDAVAFCCSGLWFGIIFFFLATVCRREERGVHAGGSHSIFATNVDSPANESAPLKFLITMHLYYMYFCTFVFYVIFCKQIWNLQRHNMLIATFARNVINIRDEGLAPCMCTHTYPSY